MSKQETFETSDIALAAYLKLKGLRLLRADRPDKFNFIFDDPEGQAEVLAIDFVNSDMRKYDDEMRSLKKIVYSNKNS